MYELYIDNDGNEVVEHKKGAKKKLSDIKERLEILNKSNDGFYIANF